MTAGLIPTCSLAVAIVAFLEDPLLIVTGFHLASTARLTARAADRDVCIIARLPVGHDRSHHGLQAQQHSFNCPYQLASPTMWPEADTADDADVYEVEMLPGDVIVLGSDGLFDNMWNFELEAIISEHLTVRIPFPSRDELLH